MRRALICIAALTILLPHCGKETDDGSSERRSAGVRSAGAEAPDTVSVGENAVLHDLAVAIGEDQVREIEAAVVGLEGRPYTALGVMAFLTGHIELAGWSFGKDALERSDDPKALNNFGVSLHEIALANPSDTSIAERRPVFQPVSIAFAAHSADPRDPYLALAIDKLRIASEAAPDEPTILSNLGYALFAAHELTGDPSLLKEAESRLREAIEIDPAHATAMAHLTELLLAKGETSAAIHLLDRARMANQLNGAVLTTQFLLPATVQEAYQSQPRQCAVDYRCAELCPRSIVGQLERVSCEIEQSSAESACLRGMPYPQGYDCEAKIPEWGWLIPGLSSGISIPTPMGRFDAVMQGDGRVDFRFKPNATIGGLGFNFEAKGNWNPKSGLSAIDFSGGVTVNMMHGNAAARMLNTYNMGPLAIGGKVDFQTGGTTYKIESYDAALISH